MRGGGRHVLEGAGRRARRDQAERRNRRQHRADRRLDSGSVTTIELFSDGYFGTPPADHVTLADWEAHIAHVEATDPFKVGPYPSTKGSSSRSFTDDRTVLLITPTPVHPREEA